MPETPTSFCSMSRSYITTPAWLFPGSLLPCCYCGHNGYILEKNNMPDTDIVCKSVCLPPPLTKKKKKKLLMTNGLWGRLKNCLPINNTSMFACLKYQIVLWSVGNSCWGCNGIFNTSLQSPGTFCPTNRPQQPELVGAHDTVVTTQCSLFYSR